MPKQPEPESEPRTRPEPATEQKGTGEIYMDAYEKEREEAHMRVIEESMGRALGRGKFKANPPTQVNP